MSPWPGLLIRCPKCGHKRFDYMSADYGACERRACGYEWRLPPSAAPVTLTQSSKGASIEPFELDGEIVEIVGPRAARVKSKSQPELWYAVDADEPACSCPGFEYNRKCRHLTKVLAFMQPATEGATT